MNRRLVLFLLISIQNVDIATSFVLQSTTTPQQRSLSIQLNMKNSHRARVEKNLEDMMGNDWRMFRAQLVAQEEAEKKNSADNSDASFSSSSSSGANAHSSQSKPMIGFGEPAEYHDEKQARQEKFGNIFAAIFSNNNKEVGPNSDRRGKGDESSQSIFSGHYIGGATPDSMIPDTCEDPFVSAAELPVLLKPTSKVDKHRWAHPLSHIEPGCVLIANEKLGGVFHQTVVLIIEHNEGSGSTGIIINRYVTNQPK